MVQIAFFLLTLGAMATTPAALALETSSSLEKEEGEAAFDGSSQVSSFKDSGNSYPTEKAQDFSIFYHGILYGPSLGSPSGYQPTPVGDRDLDRPVLLKNNLGLGYHFTENIVLAGTTYWTLETPVNGQTLVLKDPFLRLSHSQLIHENGFNLYSDLRSHFPVTSASRQSDLLWGLQTFHVFTYDPPGSRFTLGSYGSAHARFFGNQGFGDDLELYLGPNIAYMISPTVGLLVLYEMGASHAFGDQPFKFNNDGTDLEPGVVWDVTQNLMLNPYLNLFTGNRINLKSTSIGMIISWKLM